MGIFNIRIEGIVKCNGVGFLIIHCGCIVVVKGGGVCNHKLFSAVGRPAVGILICINA